jgi:uncharacterized protein (TIGR02611 family)
MKNNNRLLKQVHRLVVLLVGLPLLGVGIILIPVPGPGLLLSFLALLILSSAFQWPRPYIERTKKHLRKLIALAREKEARINEKYKDR